MLAALCVGIQIYGIRVEDDHWAERETATEDTGSSSRLFEFSSPHLHCSGRSVKPLVVSDSEIRGNREGAIRKDYHPDD